MKAIITAAGFVFLASASVAQDAGDVSVGLGLSVFGGNLEAGYQVTPSFGVRGALLGGLSADYEEQDGETNITGDAELGGFTLMGDYYPMQSGWRISGGLFFSNSDLSATGTEFIAGEGDVAVTTDASFKNDVSPMVATGYRFNLGPNFSLNTEIGVIFTGGIDVDFTADDPLLQDEVDNDPDLQDLRDDLEEIGIFPHVGLTVTYTF